MDVPGQATGRKRSERGGVVAGRGMGPRPRRFRRNAARRLRRPRTRSGHEPQRHPRLDVLPDVHRLLRASPQHDARRRHPGHGVGLQRLAHRRVGRLLPRPVHPDHHTADLESGGHERRDPPGRGQGLPGGHHAGTASPGRTSELPRRRLLGSGVPDPVRRERGDVSAHRHRIRGHQHGPRTRQSTT